MTGSRVNSRLGPARERAGVPLERQVPSRGFSRDSGDGVHRMLVSIILLVLCAGGAAAQEFQPPRVRSSAGGKGIGLYGFGVRGGIDWRNGQMIFGATLDLGDLFTPRLRLRPSAELGVFKGENSYIGSFEGLYRFTGDDEMAIQRSGFATAATD